MTIQWDEGLRLGVPTIDAHHEELFAHFARLTDAIQRGDGKEVVLELLAYLDDYVSIHFEEEERLMELCAYPRLEDQRNDHVVFKENIAALLDLQHSQASSRELTMRMLASFVRYCINHIDKFDKDLARYLKLQTA